MPDDIAHLRAAFLKALDEEEAIMAKARSIRKSDKLSELEAENRKLKEELKKINDKKEKAEDEWNKKNSRFQRLDI